MRPILPPGSLVVAVPLDDDTTLEPGDVVIARRPDRMGVEIVKRILAVARTGDYLLAGDNPSASTESVDFGPVGREQIVARVRWRYWPWPPRRISRRPAR